MKNNKSMSLPELTFQGGTKAAGKVFSLVKPRLAGLTHTLFKPVQIPPPAWWADALIPIDGGDRL